MKDLIYLEGVEGIEQLASYAFVPLLSVLRRAAQGISNP